MTPEEQGAAASALADRLRQEIAGAPQLVALQALLSTFHALAVDNPACWERAAGDVTFVAITLNNRLLQLPPPGASIH